MDRVLAAEVAEIVNSHGSDKLTSRKIRQILEERHSTNFDARKTEINEYIDSVLQLQQDPREGKQPEKQAAANPSDHIDDAHDDDASEEDEPQPRKRAKTKDELASKQKKGLEEKTEKAFSCVTARSFFDHCFSHHVAPWPARSQNGQHGHFALPYVVSQVLACFLQLYVGSNEWLLSGRPPPRDAGKIQANKMTTSKFLKNAPRLDIEVCGNTLTGEARSFKEDPKGKSNKGWYLGGKIEIPVGNKTLWASIGCNITIIGSKQWD